VAEAASTPRPIRCGLKGGEGSKWAEAQPFASRDIADAYMARISLSAERAF